MDELTRERYSLTAPADLEAERWPWRDKPQTNSSAQIARRRRDLWRSLSSDPFDAEDVE